MLLPASCPAGPMHATAHARAVVRVVYAKTQYHGHLEDGFGR